jgi:hypothetical protein
MSTDKPGLSRRHFLQVSALALGGTTLGATSASTGGTDPRVVVVRDPGDTVASAPPVRWAVAELKGALARAGIVLEEVPAIDAAHGEGLQVVLAGHDRPAAATALKAAGASALRPEGVAHLPLAGSRAGALVVSGADARGLMYGVLELVDRVEYADRPLDTLRATPRLVESPANTVRAIGRPFVSDVEDKPWFYDREFWPEYFAMLARQRINRFHFSLGFGYDTLRWVTDAYLLFPYPFLVAAPGHDVRAIGLPDAERDRNLDTLRFISREAVAHGIDFQLGMWTHGYTWADSPTANYTIEGLGPSNHAAYCRDALTAVLRACPDVSGVTLRTHYESGVKEGSYGFWKTIFDGVPACGRRVEMELHVKGLDQKMVDAALSTGMPVRLCGKYWAEHTGLPYQQTAIRELELPKADGADPFSALSFGSRNHTRYGYADFLTEARPYGFMFRVFPGTHKFLLWGDPLTAAAHARAFQFCGSEGAELLEPLAFKGRRGSGIAGGRCGYADQALNPRRDWEKFRYTYLLWGRLLYNPDTAPETWQRLLRREYRAAAPAVESALATATRILPLITTAHMPSAAQDTYSPEFYTNHSIPVPDATSPYGDTPEPKMFATVSPLDPEIFAGVGEWVRRSLAGEEDPRYAPVDVAQWLDQLADSTAASLAGAGGASSESSSPAFRRARIDVRMQVGLGRFFASKLRSGALHEIHRQAGSRIALEAALRLYRQARAAWAAFVADAQGIYVPDITFGPLPHQRGHWQDRLAAIDADIAVMEQELAALAPAGATPPRVQAAIDRVLAWQPRLALECRHTPPAHLAVGRPLPLSLSVVRPASPSVVRLHYRHVSQAERYQAVDMAQDGGVYQAAVPAEYVSSRLSLQYFFEVRTRTGQAALFPGLNRDLTNQPYFVVRT